MTIGAPTQMRAPASGDISDKKRHPMTFTPSKGQPLLIQGLQLNTHTLVGVLGTSLRAMQRSTVCAREGPSKKKMPQGGMSEDNATKYQNTDEHYW